jgi:Acyl-coenzyme A:6-aminopenicillanic acid acyl-transferase.
MAFDHPGTQIADRTALKNADGPVAAGGKNRGRPKWKWPKRILFGTVVFAFTGWSVGALLLRSWTARPPPLPANASILQVKTKEHDGKVWLGQSWVGHREGLLTVYLKGGPFELGYANGVLLQPQIHTLENEFIKMIHGYVPNGWTLNVLKWYVIYRNRHLTDYVPADYRLEIFGSTVGCPDAHPEIGPYYNRVLNYHAAHDVSYMMIDNPLVSRAGCTSFGAWGSATANGHLLTGRNFDWEAAEVFSRDRVVVMCEPDNGIPFISLSWAGMSGVVSGMNRAGVCVTVNGAPSSLPRETATPVAIVARDILQKAHNLNETLGILRGEKVFVSTLWLIGSKTDGKFIVVEKTPEVTQVREPEGDWIVCANHFETPGLRDGFRNQQHIAEATSASRKMRMTELIERAHGRIDAPLAVDFLRDRKLPGGAFVGNGNRGSLNALIATHATVMDLTDGIFWAASPPNQLGKFVAYDVRDFSHEMPEKTVPTDPTLDSGEFERARQAKQCLSDGHQALKNNQAQTALSLAEKAESLNPGFYQNAALRGRALLALGKREEAEAAFSTALAAKPAFLKEKQEIEGLLEQMHSNAPK